MSRHSNQRHRPDHSNVHHAHIPYWKRAHTDWRFWFGVMLMFVAMLVYVMSGDLALRPGTRPRQPLPADAVK
jgi:hypothetical protein